MELPFKLYKKHKSSAKARWKSRGVNMDNFEEIYQKYIVATHCELCNKQFKSSKGRCMEHNHSTGEFRNIVCDSCNQRKGDIKISTLNSTGYRGININTRPDLSQGLRYEFKVRINKKQVTIKSSVDKEKLIAFAEQWKKDNDYNT